ncbi:MAG: septum site-determining protein MinC [Candidatus Sericytochromatia bacterium]|nr:septum site-determining protein MinC [Candidatus Sericytochromatia bacterium]
MSELLIKGSPRGVTLTLPDGDDWGAVCDTFETHLQAAQSFLTGTRVSLDLGKQAPSAEALGELRAHLAQRFSVDVVALVGDTPELEKLAEEATLALLAPESSSARAGDDGSAPDLGAFIPNNAHYMRQTIRSGQSIRHFGTIVICGDVNPGAEVIATGDIIVFGTLRGVAHAGATGDAGTQVVAINLRPTQIRIAGHIARSPDSAAPPLSKYPEVARIQDGEIHILPLRDTI